MKKLLSMALAMMLAFASMGVVATGEEVETDPNLVFYTGFEVANLTESGIIGNTGREGGITADEHYLGEKCAWVAVESSAGDHRLVLNNQSVESGKVYKLSFWYKFKGQYTEFAPTIYAGMTNPANTAALTWTMWSTKNNGGAVVPKSVADKWNYYEIYLPLPVYEEGVTPKLTVMFRASQTGKASDIQYYDEIRLEKVNGTSFSFAEATGFAMSDLSNAAFGATSGELASSGINITLGDAQATAFAFAIKSVPKTEATGVVRVLSHYVPKTTNDKAVLVAGVYEELENGTRSLKDIFVKPCDFAAVDGKLGAGINYVDVDMTDYEGCYIKTFMLSGMTDLKPVSEKVTLPAAVTPAA